MYSFESFIDFFMKCFITFNSLLLCATALLPFTAASALSLAAGIPRRLIAFDNVCAWSYPRTSPHGPFWKGGDGYLTRGRAYVVAKNAKQAEADLTSALEWLSDARSRKVAEDNLASLAKANR